MKKKLFATKAEIWAALVSRGDEHSDTWMYEHDFIELLTNRFGETSDDWEVLQISSGVAAFLINLTDSVIDSALLLDLRSCLLATIPELCVYINVFSRPIGTPGAKLHAVVAVMESEWWVWPGQSAIVASLPDLAP